MNFNGYAAEASGKINAALVHHRSLLQRFHLPMTVSDWSKRFSAQVTEAARRSVEFLSGILGSWLSRILWVIFIPISLSGSLEIWIT